MLALTEPGLYRLIFRSNKRIAERFRRWVFHEVLPSIRKTGSYSAEPKVLSPLEILEQQVVLMRAQEARIKEVARLQVEQQAQIEGVQEQIDEVSERQDDTEKRVEDAKRVAQAAMDTHSSNFGHYSILGYCNLIGLRVNCKQSALHGRRVSRICRDKEIKIPKVYDGRFGTVGIYPQRILYVYFKGLGHVRHGLTVPGSVR